MGKSSFPPGFRFSPTDVELVKYYLKRKVMGRKLRIEVISEVDIYKYAPWDLPDKSCWHYGDLKWYFFCPREKKYASGARMNRATERGYWKATGKDRSVHYNGEVVGWIKTLIFHTGRPPKGERTNWVCHEYRVEDKGLADMGVPQDSHVLCIIFQKEGPGPRNGAQYGAPFNEEDWTDDEAEICLDAVLHASRPELDHVMPNNCNSSTTSGTVSTGAICIGPSSESCVSVAVPPSCNVLQSVSRNYVSIEEHNHSSNDDILSLFDYLFEESANENDKIKEPDSFLDQKGESNSCIHSGNSNVTQEVGNMIHSGNASSAREVNDLIHVGIKNTTQESDGIIQCENVTAPAYPNRSDIYIDLEDLGNVGRVADEYYMSSGNSSLYTVDDIFELADLDKPLN